MNFLTHNVKHTDSSSVENKDYVQQAAAPLDSETHGGEDVAVLARGPMAHLFQGVNEQSYLAHAMAYASCVGANQNHCASGRSSAPDTPCPSMLAVLMGAAMLAILY